MKPAFASGHVPQNPEICLPHTASSAGSGSVPLASMELHSPLVPKGKTEFADDGLASTSSRPGPQISFRLYRAPRESTLGRSAANLDVGRRRKGDEGHLCQGVAWLE
jgi:hypothetical protein